MMLLIMIIVSSRNAEVCILKSEIIKTERERKFQLEAVAKHLMN